jgi:UrcA family protein
MHGSKGFRGAHLTSANEARHRQLPWIVLACLLAGSALAEEVGAPTAPEAKVRLHYDRKELTSPVGARRLLVRIGNAALEACGASAFSLPDYKAATLASPCWREAVDDAVSRIGSPVLSEVANERHR